MNNKFLHLLWLTLLMGLVATIDLYIGTVRIPLPDLISILSGGITSTASWQIIVLDFRLPKVITAIFAGAGLSISGLQMQTLFKNPLAGPFVLGISSGASLGVAILVLTTAGTAGLVWLGISMKWFTVLAASVGAAMVLGLVVFASIRIRDNTTILIVGLMFGSLSGALVSVLQSGSQAEQIQTFLIWTFGSLGGVHWSEMKILVSFIVIGFGLALVLAKPLNALLLGDNYAQSMGLSIKNTRFWIIASTSLLAGVITAFCGPLAFIGIAVPHIARTIFRTSDHHFLIPAVALIGASLMLFCDIIAQIPGQTQALPINAATSLVGAPMVVWILMSQKSLSRTFA